MSGSLNEKMLTANVVASLTHIFASRRQVSHRGEHEDPHPMQVAGNMKSSIWLKSACIIHIIKERDAKTIRQLYVYYKYMFSLFKKEEVGQAVGLDIGASSVKVVQLRREKDKIVLDTYGEVEVGPYAGLTPGQPTSLGEDKLIEVVKDLFREAKVTAKDAVVSIDASAAYVSLVKVSKVDDAQLMTMMSFEAKKYIPIPLTDVQMDWWHVPEDSVVKNDEGMMSVVLAAVKNEVLSMNERLVKALGLTNVEYEMPGYSLMRSCPPGTHVMAVYLDIGSQFTTLSLVSKDTVLDMHVISRGSKNSTDQIAKALSIPIDTAEETKRRFGYLGDASNPYLKDVMQLSSYPLFGEVARLSLMYERKYNQVIEGVILVGGGSRVPGVMQAYDQTVHIPARVATPFDSVDVPDFLHEMIQKVGPTYAVALGCALKKLVPQK
jgi:type IV pilus assembly protein PilM